MKSKHQLIIDAIPMAMVHKSITSDIHYKVSNHICQGVTVDGGLGVVLQVDIRIFKAVWSNIEELNRKS